MNFIPGGGATEDDIAYSIEPETITVAGAEEDMADADRDLPGQHGPVHGGGTEQLQTITIDLDPRLENVSGITTATVTRDRRGPGHPNVPDVDNITASECARAISVSMVTQARTVQVRGRAEDLDLIDASQLRIVADLSGHHLTGTYPCPSGSIWTPAARWACIGEYTIVVTSAADRQAHQWEAHQP